MQMAHFLAHGLDVHRPSSCEVYPNVQDHGPNVGHLVVQVVVPIPLSHVLLVCTLISRLRIFGGGSLRPAGSAVWWTALKRQCPSFETVRREELCGHGDLSRSSSAERSEGEGKAKRGR